MLLGVILFWCGVVLLCEEKCDGVCKWVDLVGMLLVVVGVGVLVLVIV